MLGHDPHTYRQPTAMETGWAGAAVNRRGYGPDGETVWLHGPEPLGSRGGARYAVRTRTPQPGRIERAWVWNGGCAIFLTRRQAEEAFRDRVLADGLG